MPRRRDFVIATAMWIAATGVLSMHLWSSLGHHPPIVVFGWVAANTAPFLLLTLLLLRFPPQPAILFAIGPFFAVAQPLLQYGCMRLLADVVRLPTVFGTVGEFPDAMFEMMRAKLPLNLATYAGIAVALHLISLTRQRDAQQLRESQLEALARDAELRSLQGRLQPHFLFNALHSVVALIDEDPDAARSMLVRLSELLRMTLARGGDELVPLRDELRWCDAYLEIERTRFGDRLSAEMNVSENAGAISVPALILQPLVENAIKHGIARSEEGGTIRIRADREGSSLVVDIETLLGSAVAAEPVEGLGTGLEVTRSRLELLYPTQAAVDLRHDARHSHVRLVLPAGAAS